MSEFRSWLERANLPSTVRQRACQPAECWLISGASNVSSGASFSGRGIMTANREMVNVL